MPQSHTKYSIVLHYIHHKLTLNTPQSKTKYTTQSHSVHHRVILNHCMLILNTGESASRTGIILDNESNSELELYFKLRTETFLYRTYMTIKYY